MNKKNLISIFIIIAIIFMAANVFAYTTKGSIPNLANTNKGNIFNLKINEITYTKYSEPQTVENMGNRLYCGHIDIKTSAMTGNSRNLALSILISRPFNDKSIYPRYIEEIYLSGLEGKNQFVSRENKKLWLYSPSSNSTDHKIYLYEEELCSAETLDVYIFKPYYPAVSRAARTGLFAYLGVTLPVFSLINLYNFTSDSVFEDYQEKVYVHHYKRALLNQGYVISAFDLKRNASKLYNINNTENSSDGDAYFYNVDYAYGVPASSGTSAAATSVNCSTNCSGYTKSTTYPTSSVTVGGQSLSRGQVCYKCNDSGTMADRCNPFNGQKSGFTLNLASYPDLKTEICPNVGATNTSGSSGTPAQNTDAGRGSGGTQTPAECPAEYSMTFELYPNQKFKCVVEGTIPRYQSCSVTNGVVTISNVLSFENNSDQFRLSICSSIVQENQPTSNTVASNTPQNTLEILNNSNLSDINFSLNNTNWYIVNKIDNPESYILGNKTQDKNLSINLDSFNEGPIYAIISTANKKTEIETELKQIYQTGAFTNYVRQTGTNQFKIDATFTGFSKLEYSLDNNSKNLKINIKRENTLENIVLIFMQKSTDKVNLVYTNLYSLDNKSQSLFNYCMVNRNIVNFYCKGHNCSSNASCLSSGRWDFDPKIFEGLTPRVVESTAPVVPIAPVITQQPTPPVENVTLQKGADGCYTSNPTTLAKIRQENGIGITKQQFSGKRTMSSIVLPTTNTGTDDDPSLTIAQIRTAFNRSGTNIPQKVKDASPAFYNLGLLYDIDPVFILAFFKAERSMFNQNSPSITQTMINNNDISGVSYCRCGGVDTGNYCSYPTLEQGIEATYLNLTRGTTYSPNLYRNKSFSAVSKSWNGKDSYVTSMTGYLADTYTWAGK